MFTSVIYLHYCVLKSCLPFSAIQTAGCSPPPVVSSHQTFQIKCRESPFSCEEHFPSPWVMADFDSPPAVAIAFSPQLRSSLLPARTNRLDRCPLRCSSGLFSFADSQSPKIYLISVILLLGLLYPPCFLLLARLVKTCSPASPPSSFLFLSLAKSCLFPPWSCAAEKRCHVMVLTVGSVFFSALHGGPLFLRPMVKRIFSCRKLNDRTRVVCAKRKMLFHPL